MRKIPFKTALVQHIVALALMTSSGVALAADTGPLIVVTPSSGAPTATAVIPGAAGFDFASLKVRIAAAQAYQTAGLRYDPAFEKITPVIERAANGQLQLRLSSLPSGLKDFDLLLVLSDRLRLTIVEYRVDLQGTNRQFEPAPAGTHMGLQAARGATGKPLPGAALPASAPAAPRTAASAPSAAASEPATATATATTPTAPAAAGDEPEAVVQAWARAWSRKDVEAYVATYAEDYAGEGRRVGGREAWLTQRRERIGRRAAIDVSLSGVHQWRRPDGRVQVRFKQRYRGDDWLEISSKELLLEKENGRWVIVRERELH